MATREDCERRIRKAIEEIAAKPRSVLFAEIDWVMTHLRDDLGYRVRITGQNQHYTYTINGLQPFQVCDHHKGQKQVKPVYVRAFLARMMELGLL
jgi:hypothetical protein